MVFRGFSFFFFFEFCIFGSTTSEVETYRNVNYSLYYKDKIEYKKAMMYFLLWGKKLPIILVFFLVIIKLPWDHWKMAGIWLWNKIGIVSCLFWKISFGTCKRSSSCKRAPALFQAQGWKPGFHSQFKKYNLCDLTFKWLLL